MRSSIAAKAVLLLLASTAVAAGPSASATFNAADIARWLNQLGDAEPTVREDARVALMGLSPDDLPLLRTAVGAAKPLRPGSQEPLHDVVTYVVSRALLTQLPSKGDGLLGVRWPPDADLTLADPQGDPGPGVPIDQRLSGFVAYRYLEQGDLILGQAIRGRVRATYTKADLQVLVREHAAGDRITLLVLRAGRTLAIHLTLDAHPILVSPMGEQRQFDSMLQMVNAQAEAYFQQQFAPLLPADDDA